MGFLMEKSACQSVMRLRKYCDSKCVMWAVPCRISHTEMHPLTRALEGGAKNALPSGFSRIAEKRRRAAPPFFQYLLRIELHTLCQNFNPRSPKVRSPGQVKVKNGFLTLRLRSGHTRYPIDFKPSVFHKITDTYNLYISDFLYL